MPSSKAPSISGTASSSRASHVSGVQLTPSQSTASSTSVEGAVVYTPSATSETVRTPAASVASAIPTVSTSLNAVFARLGLEDQRKALRSLQNSALSQALGCTQKEVANLIVISSSDELWATFCQLNIENRKKSLENTRKLALRKAFDEERGEDGTCIKTNSYSVPMSPSKATSNTLASAFEKLSVKEQKKEFASTQVDTPKTTQSGSRNDRNFCESGDGDDKGNTLIESKPDLAEWQELCRACGVEVEDIPGTITKCKEILKTKNVALSDLSEAIRCGTVAQTFPSLSQLRKHVTSQKKVANKAAVKENRFLKKMLRELFRYQSHLPRSID